MLSKGQTKTHKEVQKNVGWSQPHVYKSQQIKPYGFLHSNPQGLNVQIQRGRNGIIGTPPKQIPIWYYEKILLMLLIFHYWKMLPNFHYKKIPLNFHYKKLASIFHYKKMLPNFHYRKIPLYSSIRNSHRLSTIRILHWFSNTRKFWYCFTNPK